MNTKGLPEGGPFFTGFPCVTTEPGRPKGLPSGQMFKIMVTSRQTPIKSLTSPVLRLVHRTIKTASVRRGSVGRGRRRRFRRRG